MKKIYEDIIESLSEKNKEVIKKFYEINNTKERKIIYIQSILKEFKIIPEKFTANETIITENNISIHLGYSPTENIIKVSFKTPCTYDKLNEFDIVLTHNISEDSYSCLLSYQRKSDPSHGIYARYKENIKNNNCNIKIEDCYNSFKTEIKSFISKEDSASIYAFSQVDIIEKILNQHEELASLKDFFMLTHDIDVEDDILLKGLFDTLNNISLLKNKKQKNLKNI